MKSMAPILLLFLNVFININVHRDVEYDVGCKDTIDYLEDTTYIMGKLASVSWQTKYDALKKEDIFYNNGKLKTARFAVWNKVHSKLKNRIEKTSIYLDVKNNRKNIAYKLQQHFIKNGKVVLNKLENFEIFPLKYVKKAHSTAKEVIGTEDDVQFVLNVIEESDSSINLGESEISTDGSDYDDKPYEPQLPTIGVNPNPQNCEPMNFSIKLNHKEWLVIKPVNKKLPPYKWVPLISVKIYEVSKLPCSHRIRVGKVYTSLYNKYIDFCGYCKEKHCKTYLYGVCKQKPLKDEDGITIDISTYNTLHIFHKEKKFCSREERLQVQEKLRYMSASQYRNEKANESMKYGDCEPPFLPKLVTLRGIKAEGIRRYLGLDGPKDPIKSLLYLQNNFPFIKEVCSAPFRFWYLLDTQIELWDDIAFLNPVVTVDATGSLMKKVTINEETSSHIFLYQLMTTFDHNYVPLCQMASSRQDTNAVYAWLNEWKKRIKSSPGEFVTDGALVLLYSLCLTFNDCELKEYLNVCLYKLQNETAGFPFMCMLRMDRAHVVKLAPKDWKCLKGKDKQVRDFYTRTITLASTCAKLSDLKDILLATFVVCESQYMPCDSKCFEKYTWLKEKMKIFGEEGDAKEYKWLKEQMDICGEEEKQEFIKIENTEEDINKYIGDNDVKSFVLNIHQEALAIIKEDKCALTLNSFRCNDLKNNIINLYCLFPLWTNVMVPIFGSSHDVATSAANEAYWKDLRNTYNLKNALGAAIFLLKHVKIIEAQVKIAKARLDQIIKEIDNKLSEEEITEITPEENKEMIAGKVVQKEELSRECRQLQNNSYYEANEQIIKEMESTLSEEEITEIKTEVSKEIIIGKVIQKEELSRDCRQLNNSSCSLENEQSLPSNIKDKDKKLRKAKIQAENDEKITHGHLRNGGTIIIDVEKNKLLSLFNTCGFDSIFALKTHAYENNDIIRAYTDENATNNGLFFSTIKNYSTQILNMKDLYINRAFILMNYGQLDQSETYLDCECNVPALFDALMGNQRCSTRTVICNRDACGYAREEVCRSLIINDGIAKQLYKTKSPDFIKHCITQSFLLSEVLKCRKCKSLTAMTYITLDSFLAIDIDNTFKNYNISTNNIPKMLSLGGKSLHLLGFIVYEPGHYYACCYHKKIKMYEIKNDLNESPYFIREEDLSHNLKLSLLLYGIDFET